jgi:hypothetical protein
VLGVVRGNELVGVLQLFNGLRRSHGGAGKRAAAALEGIFTAGLVASTGARVQRRTVRVRASRWGRLGKVRFFLRIQTYTLEVRTGWASGRSGVEATVPPPVGGFSEQTSQPSLAQSTEECEALMLGCTETSRLILNRNQS